MKDFWGFRFRRGFHWFEVYFYVFCRLCRLKEDRIHFGRSLSSVKPPKYAHVLSAACGDQVPVNGCEQLWVKDLLHPPYTVAVSWENRIWVIPCQINKFFANFQLDHLRFWWNFHRMCINVLEHAVQNFAAIFSVFFFWRNFKDVWCEPVYRDLQIAS